MRGSSLLGAQAPACGVQRSLPHHTLRARTPSSAVCPAVSGSSGGPLYTPSTAGSSTSSLYIPGPSSSGPLPRPLTGSAAGPSPRSEGGRTPSLILPNGVAAPSAAAPATSASASANASSSANRTAAPVPASSKDEPNVVSPFSPLDGPVIWVGGQRAHSLGPRGREVFQSMQQWAGQELPKFLKPVDRIWQPADLLPDPADPYFLDAVREVRAAAANLPADYMVVLVGDMITEEALPSYMSMLNRHDEASDETGACDTPWARWTREWTAEENRHGDILNKYLYLSGRVDMRAVEVTIQNLIGSGLDPKLENNPYLTFVYTSFQERATKISHGNTARLANYHGDPVLAKLCGLIASDEGRHEAAYTAIVAELFRRDPDGAMLAFADMMRKGIVMPAHFMEDGWHQDANSSNLFLDYASVADAIGVYTTVDYAAIVDHLVNRWSITDIRVESGQAAAAQEFLVKHSERIRRLADIQMERRLRDRRRGKTKSAAFSWIFKREVSLT